MRAPTYWELLEFVDACRASADALECSSGAELVTTPEDVWLRTLGRVPRSWERLMEWCGHDFVPPPTAGAWLYAAGLRLQEGSSYTSSRSWPSVEESFAHEDEEADED
jgi:hypothetical protein